MGNRWGNNENSDILFSWARKSLRTVTSVMKVKDVFSLGGKAMMNLDSVFKRRDIISLTKVHIVKAMVFPSSHVWM